MQTDSDPQVCIICSLGEEPVKIKKEASRDKSRMSFNKNVQAKCESQHSNH